MGREDVTQRDCDLRPLRRERHYLVRIGLSYGVQKEGFDFIPKFDPVGWKDTDEGRVELMCFGRSRIKDDKG